MIKYITQDVSKIPRGVVAHGVNCQGVMGSGVALALRQQYPIIFPQYSKLCAFYNTMPEVLLGYVNFVDARPDNELIVANCFTQVYYGRTGGPYADAVAIKRAVRDATAVALELGLPFFMPKIGCGLGGLSWEKEVESIINELSNDVGIDVYVCTF